MSIDYFIATNCGVRHGVSMSEFSRTEFEFARTVDRPKPLNDSAVMATVYNVFCQSI